MADLIWKRQRSSLVSPHVRLTAWRAGLLGAVAGLASACVISVGGDDWGGDPDECFDEYGDCMDDAESPAEIEACDVELDSCLDACGKGDDDGQGWGETGGDGDPDSGDGDSDDPDTGDSDGPDTGNSGDGDGDSGDGDSDTGDSGDGDGDYPGDGDGDEDPPHSTTGGDGDGDENPPHATTGGDGDGDGDGIDPACFDILAACVDAAETIQDIDACEALFDNCANPPPCEECEEPGCPQAELDACVEDYGACADAADTNEEVLACEAGFDDCIGQFDVGLCLPNYDDDLVSVCLGQNHLCVACAEGPEGLAACQGAFENCLEG